MTDIQLPFPFLPLDVLGTLEDEVLRRSAMALQAMCNPSYGSAVSLPGEMLQHASAQLQSTRDILTQRLAAARVEALLAGNAEAAKLIDATPIFLQPPAPAPAPAPAASQSAAGAPGVSAPMPAAASLSMTPAQPKLPIAGRRAASLAASPAVSPASSNPMPSSASTSKLRASTCSAGSDRQSVAASVSSASSWRARRKSKPSRSARTNSKPRKGVVAARFVHSTDDPATAFFTTASSKPKRHWGPGAPKRKPARKPKPKHGVASAKPPIAGKATTTSRGGAGFGERSSAASHPASSAAAATGGGREAGAAGKHGAPISSTEVIASVGHAPGPCEAVPAAPPASAAIADTPEAGHQLSRHSKHSADADQHDEQAAAAAELQQDQQPADITPAWLSRSSSSGSSPGSQVSTSAGGRSGQQNPACPGGDQEPVWLQSSSSSASASSPARVDVSTTAAPVPQRTQHIQVTSLRSAPRAPTWLDSPERVEPSTRSPRELRVAPGNLRAALAAPVDLSIPVHLPSPTGATPMLEEQGEVPASVAPRPPPSPAQPAQAQQWLGPSAAVLADLFPTWASLFVAGLSGGGASASTTRGGWAASSGASQMAAHAGAGAAASPAITQQSAGDQARPALARLRRVVQYWLPKLAALSEAMIDWSEAASAAAENAHCVWADMVDGSSAGMADPATAMSVEHERSSSDSGADADPGSSDRVLGRSTAQRLRAAINTDDAPSLRVVVDAESGQRDVVEHSGQELESAAPALRIVAAAPHARRAQAALRLIQAQHTVCSSAQRVYVANEGQALVSWQWVLATAPAPSPVSASQPVPWLTSIAVGMPSEKRKQAKSDSRGSVAKQLRAPDPSFRFTWQRQHGLQGIAQLTRKDLLVHNLTRYAVLGGRLASAFDITPKAFVLPQQFNALLREHAAASRRGTPGASSVSALAQAALSAYNAGSSSSMPGSASAAAASGPIWIVKPAAASCGRGIWITQDVRKLGEIREGTPHVAQIYVPNPLTVDGFKFDLRVYIAVTSTAPLEAWVYYDGLARFASTAYDSSATALGTLSSHLCNTSITKGQGAQPSFLQHNAPAAHVGHCKCSLTWLWGLLAERGWDVRALWQQTRDVIVRALAVADDTIAHQPGAFTVLGFDVLFDEHGKAWLIEANAAPSMATGSPLDARLKCGVWAGLLRLLDVPPARADQLLPAVQALDAKLNSGDPHAVFRVLPAGDSRRAALDQAIQAAMQGALPRQYGMLPAGSTLGDAEAGKPASVAGWERLAPGEVEYNEAMQLKWQAFSTRWAASKGNTG